MKDIFSDERADSMLVLIIASAILCFGLFYIVFSYAYNAPIDIMNDMIAQGEVSQQTVSAWEMMMSIWKATPLFFIVGLVIYSFERSKGTDISSGKFFGYLFLMIAGIVTSSYVLYALGLAADGFINALDATTFTDVSDIWDTSDKREFLVTAMYYMSMLPAFLVSILFMFFPIIQQREIGIFSTEPSAPAQDYADDMSLEQY